MVLFMPALYFLVVLQIYSFDCRFKIKHTVNQYQWGLQPGICCKPYLLLFKINNSLSKVLPLDISAVITILYRKGRPRFF